MVLPKLLFLHTAMVATVYINHIVCVHAGNLSVVIPVCTIKQHLPSRTVVVLEGA